jgi:hypothetical protein
MARRSFIRSLGLGAALLTPAAGMIAGAGRLRAATLGSSGATSGDIDIMRFLAAAELLEADLWQQYTELANGNDTYKEAIEAIDDDFPQYIADNTDDEISHANFLNAYIASVGGEPVNLDAFRTLPSSKATGAQQIGRLTNLINLTVDTSWWIRYRSPDNPDFGATFPQLINIVNQPAIPPHDLRPENVFRQSQILPPSILERSNRAVRVFTTRCQSKSQTTVLWIATSIEARKYSTSQSGTTTPATSYQCMFQV